MTKSPADFRVHKLLPKDFGLKTVSKVGIFGLPTSVGAARSGSGVGDTEVARCEAGKPAVVKVKHESWQAAGHLFHIFPIFGLAKFFQRSIVSPIFPNFFQFFSEKKVG